VYIFSPDTFPNIPLKTEFFNNAGLEQLVIYPFLKLKLNSNQKKTNFKEVLGSIRDVIGKRGYPPERVDIGVRILRK
jgi:hypothetical protein